MKFGIVKAKKSINISGGLQDLRVTRENAIAP